MNGTSFVSESAEGMDPVESLKHLQKEWTVIAAAPWDFAIAVAIVFSLPWWLCGPVIRRERDLKNSYEEDLRRERGLTQSLRQEVDGERRLNEYLQQQLERPFITPDERGGPNP